MNDLHALSIFVDDNQLSILDQTQLPNKKQWLVCDSIDSMVLMIQKLQIRGAPAIGIAACLLLAIKAEKGLAEEDFIRNANRLRAARPTAVNLMNNIDSLLQASKTGYPKSVVDEAERLFYEDIELCNKLSELGNSLISPNSNILTHCNTGGLATVGVGTAIGVIRKAHGSGKNVKVWVGETRPLLQGGRLTAWEMGELGVPYRLICDSMAAMLMARGEVDCIFVGADRIAANGDFANKIGTYNLAVLASYHEIPFYVVAPHTTVDLACENGNLIPIEERNASEVKGVSGGFGDCIWAPEGAPVYNPAFDVTPAHLVSAWILDTGIYRVEDVQTGKLARR
ncbi:S-methyl-5-thioribose-1-phosphate isomerase [Marinomonas sp. 15G1-11]|uniref:Methylthioribose-1-phosphate isomerase n=1 Tax=Marinomonas phaeophyticola TaxID=3004091 RepID=A0ABT4JWB2_9GAMM|nr:S-methyl-5-thioribose-1-phosphate isomerase [Marinomonas sp. 15G1-11]MCZ2722535.1 S-methyl-5-thioribose-1-phosphate isomerase [Marinomonas sp. 15G1-11]